jgi:hypothetical protein
MKLIVENSEFLIHCSGIYIIKICIGMVIAAEKFAKSNDFPLETDHIDLSSFSSSKLVSFGERFWMAE